jgi:hypothetical protein
MWLKKAKTFWALNQAKYRLGGSSIRAILTLSPVVQFASKGEKMKLIKGLAPKGETNGYYIILGVLIALAVIFVVKYHDDHKDDLTIHPPHIDLH